MKPDFAIIEKQQQGDMIRLTIDTQQATYQNIPWLSLGDYGKRKFETLAMLMNAPKQVTLTYV